MTAPTLAPILRFALAERRWPGTARLEALAGWLPAVPVAGLEVPLVGEGAVDLQQRLRTPRELRRLRRALERPGPDPGPAWAALLRYCEADLLGGQVEEVWLELDDRGAASAPSLSLFVRLPNGPSLDRTLQAIARLHDAFGLPLSGARQSALERCLGACPAGAMVSHLGLMVERLGSPIRLIVEGIALDRLEAYLTRAGWDGGTAELAQDAEALFTRLDRVRLALTVGEKLHSPLGFECFLGDPTEYDPRWPIILANLRQLGLCDAEPCARVLSWPGQITPGAAGQPWPQALMVDALLRDPREYGWLDCRISHVKVSYQDGRLSSAKAYLGFIDTWKTPAKSPAPAPAGVADSLPARGVAEAIEAALGFLLAGRTQAGWWIDYVNPVLGASDHWVTAYVANALAETGDARAQAAARRAWDLLQHRGQEGWGWNEIFPEDSDSTAWALRLAGQLGALDGARARRALAALGRFAQPDGGFASYLRPDGVAPAVSFAQWHETHLCVTAPAAEMEALGEAPLDCLRRTQQTDGHWQSYWWLGPCYATAHAVDALCARGAGADRARVERAAQWAGQWLLGPSALDPAENPLDTALAYRILLTAWGRHGDPGGRTRQRLLACQHADGSWRSSATLEFPMDPRPVMRLEDKRRLMTTATVLRTLIRLRALEGGTPSPLL